jgi:hypothetical protein
MKRAKWRLRLMGLLCLFVLFGCWHWHWGASLAVQPYHCPAGTQYHLEFLPGWHPDAQALQEPGIIHWFGDWGFQTCSGSTTITTG